MLVVVIQPIPDFSHVPKDKVRKVKGTEEHKSVKTNEDSTEEENHQTKAGRRREANLHIK